MRNNLLALLIKKVATDKSVVFIVGDLGFGVVEPFMKQFPKQFLNAGVAEGNMVGVAAGMALEGFTPVCYTIGTFMSLRPFEQIRDDICVRNLNAKFIGIGAGYGYSIYGPTHHSNDDIGVLRNLPNMVILSPADPLELKGAFRVMFSHRGPVYLRLPRRSVEPIHARLPHFELGKSIIVKPGNDRFIFATGTMVTNALEAAKRLDQLGKPTGVVSFPTIKPIDQKFIINVAKRAKLIVTLEPHSVIGGLGSAVAEVLAEAPTKARFKRFGYPDQFVHVAGSEQYLEKQFGLDPASVAAHITKLS
ncbi:hypothetical protein HYZ64_00780 [Candidatus Berkelbacteria bacterium]|nr:hypothetical protein [Candidatus Berkelbacteria bacterium]